ncbi:hypothetical protein GCM10026982_53350 [Nocardiopsis aegyptia]
MPTITLAAMIITPATIMSGRCPIVMDMRREPDPVMIGMMIIAPELPAGAFSGICGGVAITRGLSPGEGGVLRAGRGTALVATVLSFRSTWWGAGVWGLGYTKGSLATTVKHVIRSEVDLRGGNHHAVAGGTRSARTSEPPARPRLAVPDMSR